MEIVSRQAAKAASLKYYFTGKPCNLGGIADSSHPVNPEQAEAYPR